MGVSSDENMEIQRTIQNVMTWVSPKVIGFLVWNVLQSPYVLFEVILWRTPFVNNGGSQHSDENLSKLKRLMISISIKDSVYSIFYE